ncbi:MAG: hypothetical protein MZU97_12875 [Bacillus subtilis]|nr:hypothetical protein [Bacillus subtilis]
MVFGCRIDQFLHLHHDTGAEHHALYEVECHFVSFGIPKFQWYGPTDVFVRFWCKPSGGDGAYCTITNRLYIHWLERKHPGDDARERRDDHGAVHDQQPIRSVSM